MVAGARATSAPAADNVRERIADYPGKRADDCRQVGAVRHQPQQLPGRRRQRLLASVRDPGPFPPPVRQEDPDSLQQVSAAAKVCG